MSDQTLSHIYSEAGTFYPQATCGGYTATFEAGVTVDPALAAPTGLAASAEGPTSVGLTWNTLAGADSYVVTYWPTATPTATSTTTSTTASATVTGLTASTEYGFSVHGVDENGADGAESTSVTATTDPPQLPTPANVTAGTLTATTADVSWSPSAGATAYTVSWALTSTPNVPIDSESVTATTYQITGLTASTGYTVSVVATAAGSSDSNPGTTTFTTTA